MLLTYIVLIVVTYYQLLLDDICIYNHMSIRTAYTHGYTTYTHTYVVLTQNGAGKGKKPFLTAGLIAPSPAHTHRAMLARGDFFNNMKAPGVVSTCQPDELMFDMIINDQVARG